MILPGFTCGLSVKQKSLKNQGPFEHPYMHTKQQLLQLTSGITHIAGLLC